MENETRHHEFDLLKWYIVLDVVDVPIEDSIA